MDERGFAITVDGVYKRFAGGEAGGHPALNGLNLEVRAGSVRGLLGPNGAGKTTAIRILSTLLELDAGQAHVAGFDVRRQPRQVRERIGLVGQYAAVDEILTGRQNLRMFGQLNHLSPASARNRANELLERFGLTEAAGRPVSTYSGGMRRRLDLAVSLIVAPSVLFVDEPTTGLDPVARQEVWAAIRELVQAGTTVLLTTQNLDEADKLVDHISLLKAGQVIAEGTPDNLKSAVGGDWLDIVLANGTDLEATKPIAARVAAGELRIEDASHRISVPVAERTKALVEVAIGLREAVIEPEDITLRRPTLDEVFLRLVGDAAPAGTDPDAELAFATEVPA